MIDRDIHLARALLIESNALLRSVASAQLRDLGVGHVSQASRVTDARLLLEREHFDIVLCNLELKDSGVSGQDLLDELRREHQLPLNTVFLMVTSKPSYSQVMEAAEASLDGLLVRPYSAAALSARLLEARNRKRELGDLLRALDAGEQEQALAHAVRRFQEGQRYGAYCGRLAAELLLGLERPQDAQRLFELLLAGKPAATWARLGVARAQLAQGDAAQARRTVTAVLDAEPGAADAHDLMGRLLVEQSDFDGALLAYRQAATLTPGCLLRAQHVGALAFYQGLPDEALVHLQRALSMGAQSKLFDALSLLLIAFLRFDIGDNAGVLAMHKQLHRYRENFTESSRLRRFEQAAQTLVALQSTQVAQALDLLRALADEAAAQDFDLIAANTVLALWARLPPAHKSQPGLQLELDAMLQRIALRCCTSKATAEVLAASAGRDSHAVDLIRGCQSHVAQVAEHAMAQAMQGDAAGAVADLLAAGESTGNAKLLDMANSIARRYQSSAPTGSQMAERAAAAGKRSAQPVSHIAGMHRSGRAPGSLTLRGRAHTPKELSDATT